MYTLIITWSDGIADRSQHKTAMQAADYLSSEAHHAHAEQERIEAGVEPLYTEYLDLEDKVAASIKDAILIRDGE